MGNWARARGKSPDWFFLIYHIDTVTSGRLISRNQIRRIDKKSVRTYRPIKIKLGIYTIAIIKKHLGRMRRGLVLNLFRYAWRLTERLAPVRGFPDIQAIH